MKLQGRTWALIMGMIWWGIGFALLAKGAFLFHQYGILNGRVLLLIGLAETIALLKGRFVLSKTAKRLVSKLGPLSNLVSAKQVFSRRYFFLIVIMMLLGMTLRSLQLPGDIHGAIDLCIGSALLYGSITFFIARKQESPSH